MSRWRRMQFAVSFTRQNGRHGDCRIEHTPSGVNVCAATRAQAWRMIGRLIVLAPTGEFLTAPPTGRMMTL